MKMLTRSVIALAFGLSLAGPFVRAEQPKAEAPKSDAPKTDAAKSDAPRTGTSTKPAQPKDEPSVASCKGDENDPKNKFVARHEGFMKDKAALLKKGPIGLIFIGDSITDGWRGRGKDVFAASYDQYNPYNIGISGDRTQHVLWRIDKGELDAIDPNPKVAELMIGTNNLGSNPSDESIAAGVTKVVEEIHQKLPHTKVLLLGIFPRDNKADSPRRARIKAINEIIAKLDDGGKTVKYLDIGDKFLDSEGTLSKDIMPDYLHPNAKGYQIWADATKPTLDELMK